MHDTIRSLLIIATVLTVLALWTAVGIESPDGCWLLCN